MRSSMDALVAAAAVKADTLAGAHLPEHEALALVVLDHVLNVTVLSHHAHVRAGWSVRPCHSIVGGMVVRLGRGCV